MSERVTVGDFRSDPMFPRVERAVAAILVFHCHDLNLVPSQTAYVKWGKGPRTPLRFTKIGEERVEKIYARHFVWSGKGPFHRPGEMSDVGA